MDPYEGMTFGYGNEPIQRNFDVFQPEPERADHREEVR